MSRYPLNWLPTSVVDRHRLDADSDPDQTLDYDADPDPGSTQSCTHVRKSETKFNLYSHQCQSTVN
jgi:hypothetical protein